MKIAQFEHKHLSHHSYAILSECENSTVLIDHSRVLAVCYSNAQKHDAKIVGVIEPHPHADFVSSHLQIFEEKGPKIYCSNLTSTDYPFNPFDEKDRIVLGKITLRTINTLGYSPDSK